MALATRQIYRFGSFRLDVEQRLLLRGSERLALRPRVFDTLLVLVERHGEVVTKEELLDAVWPDTVVEENNLNQNILALRRVLGNGDGADGDVRIETVSRRGYRFLAAVGEELAGPRPTPILIPAAPPAREPAPVVVAPAAAPRRHGLLLALLGLAAALAILAIWRLRAPASSSPRTIRSIAILPLKALDTGERDQPLGLGLAEAVVSRLSRDSDLLVRPLSSSRQAALATPDAVSAGARLDVDSVLEGSLEHADGRIRATIQLVRVADRRVLWSGSFEEAESEAFLLEDSIAGRLVSALGISRTVASRSPTRLPSSREAYEAYLRGRFFWNRRSAEDLEKARAEFEEAIRLDPSYALAYAGLADAYVLLGPGGPPEVFTKARAAAERAIALDPNLAEAHASLGFIRFFADWDFAGSERELRRALELNPGYVTAHHWYAYRLAAAGHSTGAIAEIRRAREIDPTSLVVSRDVGHILLYCRRYDESIEQLRRTLAMDDGFYLARSYLVEALSNAGRHAEAAAELQKLPMPHDTPIFLWQEATVEARAGRTERLRALLAGVSAATADAQHVTAPGAAWMSGLVGAYDRAFAFLEKAYGDRDFYLIFLAADPAFDSLRSDPRFAELVRRVGIPAS